MCAYCVVSDNTFYSVYVSDVVFLSILNIRRKYIGVEKWPD